MNAIATNNLRVWERFCITPKHATKEFTKGGWKGTDINPAYRLRCLTELFGPQGTGWGWTIHERWREAWPSRTKVGNDWVDYEAPCAFVMLSLWYIEDGERKECSPQIGGTECDLAPDEVWKMSITDAIGKCCLALGIAADVYMGQFDGKYRGDQPDRQTKSRPACPKCGKSEFVLEDRNTPGAFFCWRNEEKGKKGCGHKWNPAEQSNGKPAPEEGPFTSSEGALYDSLRDRITNGKTTGFRDDLMKHYREKKLTGKQLGELTGCLVHKMTTINNLNGLGKWIGEVRIEMPTEDSKCFDEVESLIAAKVEQLGGVAA